MICRMIFSMVAFFLSLSSLQAAGENTSCKWKGVADEPNTCFIDVSSIPTHPNDTIKFIYEDSDTKPAEIFAVKFHSDPDKVFHIKHFPREIFFEFPNMKTLLISSQLKSISAVDFDLGANLENLELFANQLTNIPANTFATLTKLRELDFTFNQISLIEENAFSGLKNLRVLTLAGNLITTLTSTMFKQVPNLEKLELELNLIEEIEEGALDLPKLEILNLSCNKLKKLSHQPFEYCKSLRNLVLGNNDLVNIETALYGLNKLESLDLSNNEIADMRLQELVNLPKLIKLSLLKNGASLNDSIFDVLKESSTKSSITVLNLQGNGLRSREILNKLHQWGAFQLETLDLTHNMINEIDLSLNGAFPSLTAIRLFSNPLDCKWFNNSKLQLEQQQSKLLLDVDGYFTKKCGSE